MCPCVIPPSSSLTGADCPGRPPLVARCLGLLRLLHLPAQRGRAGVAHQKHPNPPCCLRSPRPIAAARCTGAWAPRRATRSRGDASTCIPRLGLLPDGVLHAALEAGRVRRALDRTLDLARPRLPRQREVSVTVGGRRGGPVGAPCPSRPHCSQPSSARCTAWRTTGPS
eukprot:scaffold77056_cov57-Phaeocystis_antarctica.AAC.4